LVVGRIISGIGVGGVNAVVPVWQAECSKPKNRGKNVVIIGVFIAGGIALASWVNFGLSFHQKSSICWRLPLALPLVFCALICSSAFLFPESPRWLVQKQRVEEAKVILSILEDVDVESEHVVVELQCFQDAYERQSAREQGFLDLFKAGQQRLLYRTFLSILINFCAQMTGNYYIEILNYFFRF
jgi:MFS family permease